jgi:hypothetical protein
MRKTVLSAVAAIALAGCGVIGGGPKTAMIKACTDGGESEKDCTCVADKLEKDLDSETFNVVAAALLLTEEEGGSLLETLPIEKQESVMVLLLSASASCTMANDTAGTVGGL